MHTSRKSPSRPDPEPAEGAVERPPHSVFATTSAGPVESEEDPAHPGVGLGLEIKHRRPALKALTSLRFFAAIYVAVYHIASGHGLAKARVLERFISSGYTGVSLFFILSGFILAYNYRDVCSRRDFWASRFARIYPVYLLALLLSFAYTFSPAQPPMDHPALQLLMTSTLIQAWYAPFAAAINAPGWTLSVEAFFYAVFPFLLAPVRRLGPPAFALLCGLYVATLFVPLWLLLARHANDQAVTWARFLADSKFPPLHLPLFLIGVWLGARYRPEAPAARFAWTLWVGAIGSVVLLCAGSSGIAAPARGGLLALTYAALIHGLARVQSRFWTNRWLVLAGEISFSIYILQMPVFRSALGVLRRAHVGPYATVGLGLIALICASYLAYRFVELPARVAIRRRLTHLPVPLVRI